MGCTLHPSLSSLRTAVTYASAISLLHEGKRADVKSAFDLMLLGRHGAELELEVNGPDATAAAAAIASLFESGFPLH
ncbi:MAG UNVERIFIED_CONTAM: HPr family phosphocarrier protein [Planctomycetaceae bacterium]|jgi:phosphotransferase system HPr (HPr) family protein